MKIVPVVNKIRLKDEDGHADLLYWLSKTPQERLAAVTQLRKGLIQNGQRLDKTVVLKRNMHQ